MRPILPSAKGILFGYFRASETTPGRNLPGQTVFTCLSHDIIVPRNDPCGARWHSHLFFQSGPTRMYLHFTRRLRTLAALFRHFSHKEALLDTIQKTGGKLYQYHLQPDAGTDAKDGVRIQAQIAADNPLIGLAQQFWRGPRHR